MLLKRVLVAAALLPVGIAAIYFGGIFYVGLVVLILVLAAWEYGGLFRAGGYKPASIIIILGTLVLAVGRALFYFQGADWMISVVVLVSLAYHLVAFERGHGQAGTDFAITVSGVLYIGWIGAYMISLRNLPEGMWWVLLVLPAVWIADAGAYFVGKGLGRHHMTPRLSPKKTWEGYIGGILAGTLGAVLLSYLWQPLAGPGTNITPLSGLALGFILSVVTVLGDLGASMIKRQVGVKDSSSLIPGHGGVFDRIDSWLWAGVIGYYLVLWLFL
ncbi:MAG: phosphatidate cytidylyltransferase [Anaerolineales bacterium]|jgi:phosphatidate cytidylyltransferase